MYKAQLRVMEILTSDSIEDNKGDHVPNFIATHLTVVENEFQPNSECQGIAKLL